MPTLPVQALRAQRPGLAIIPAAMRLHFEPGARLEGTHQLCLQPRLKKTGFQSGMQVGFPVCNDGVNLDHGYRIDLLAGDWVRVEGKSVGAIFPPHQVVQGLWYLTLSGKSLAQLINSNIVRYPKVLYQFFLRSSVVMKRGTYGYYHNS